MTGTFAFKRRVLTCERHGVNPLNSSVGVHLPKGQNTLNVFHLVHELGGWLVSGAVTLELVYIKVVWEGLVLPSQDVGSVLWVEAGTLHVPGYK